MFDALQSYILIVHISTAIGILGIIFFVDSYIYIWMRGKIFVLDFKKMNRIHAAMWWCLGIMICSGVLLFYPYKPFLQNQTAFQLKIVFILALLTNSFYIGNIMYLARGKKYTEISHAVKIKFLVAALISGFSWLGVFIAAINLGL